MQTAVWLFRIATVYAVCGAIFAALFLTIGAGRINSAARGGSFMFRILTAPGVVTLWPVLMWKWGRAGHAQGASR